LVLCRGGFDGAFGGGEDVVAGLVGAGFGFFVDPEGQVVAQVVRRGLRKTLVYRGRADQFFLLSFLQSEHV
jgi:hypothetical protein